MTETSEIADEYQRRLDTAVALMQAATPDAEDVKRLVEYEALDAHIVAVAGHAKETAPKAAAAMLANCGINQRIRGRFEPAETNTTNALAIKEAVYGPDHHEVASTLGNLGNIQQQLGRLEEAEATQRRALTIEEAVYGPDHHEVASTLGNLGNIQEQLGRLDEAKRSVARVHAIFLRAFGSDHHSTEQARLHLKSLE